MKMKKYFKNDRTSKLLIIPLILIFLTIIAGVLYLNGGIIVKDQNFRAENFGFPEYVKNTCSILEHPKNLLKDFLCSQGVKRGNINVLDYSGKAAGIIGFSVYNTEETILEKYDSESANLSIKEPAKSGLLGLGEAVTKNKNRRMDFNLSGGGLRLYFDLLNYSEFVEGVAESSVSTIVYNATEVIANNESSQIVDNSNITFIEQNQTPLINNTNIGPNNNESNQENSSVNESFVENPTENSSTDVSAGITGNAIDENNKTDTGVINNTITNQTTSAEDITELDINDIKQTADNLSRSDVERISDNSVVKAESFDINVSSVPNMTEGKDNYKWGYKVKLNDLKFMAKIEVTTDEEISVYNENSLKIGKRNILSFEDLAKAGYKVRIQNPALEIPVNVSVNLNRVMRNITVVNETIEEIINETILNVTEVNQTEINITEINATEPITNQTEINITIPNRTTTNATEVNYTETNFTIINQTEEKKDIAINETNENKENGNKDGEEQEKEVKKEEAREEKKEKKDRQAENEERKDEVTEEEKEEVKEEEKTEEEQAPQGITGNIIRFFRLTGKAIFGMERAIAVFTGRIIGIDENMTEVEDIKYANTITVYIERDFSVVSGESMVVGGNETTNIDYEDLDNDGKISVGDIINLDPSLIIIPITNAEHLDENRSFISNIYESVKEKDDNWSEVINNSNYVRATFLQALGRSNDITVFARVSGYSCNESVVENCSEIIINETTNETQQVCENVTSEICPEIPENEKGKIEVYKENGNEIIARIENITKADWYRTYLDGEHGGIGLSDNETADVFDLRIVNAENVWINNSIFIDGKEVPHDIYQKKKRIDEIRGLLNQS